MFAIFLFTHLSKTSPLENPSCFYFVSQCCCFVMVACLCLQHIYIYIYCFFFLGGGGTS